MPVDPACKRCTDLRVTFPVSTPGKLQQTIRVVRDNIKDGTLTALSRDGDAAAFQIQTEGPWPDVIDLVFRCRECGSSFRLIVETYHGFGGSWKPLKEEPHDTGIKGRE